MTRYSGQSGDAGRGARGDPHEEQAVAPAQVEHVGPGPSGGQHRRPSPQDRVQPERLARAGAHQRIADQAANSPRSAPAQYPPRGVLQRAILEARGLRRRDRFAEAGTADRSGEGDPANRGSPVLPAGHRPTDPDRFLDHGAGVRAAFAVVCGEHIFAGQASGHIRDLPGQVVGVPQPRRQALADERRGQVGGVAEEEHPPGPEAGR